MTSKTADFLIVAAGSGSRFGAGRPKQYQHLAGAMVLRRSVQTALSHPAIARVQVVIGEGQEAHYKEAVAGLDVLPPIIGGATRQESVRAGLAALAKDAPKFVLIHDAARPLMSGDLISRVVSALEAGAAGAVLALPMTEALKRVNDKGEITDSVARENVVAAQTPQGFRFADIWNAHQTFAGENLPDDAALLEKAGAKVAVVAGERRNIKLTNAEDLAMAEALLSGEIRTGTGFDAHALAPLEIAPGDLPEGTVMLCGVGVPSTHQLVGHSDGDVGIHALCDAIYGAMAEGDIGQHFPSGEAKWKGAASSQFLHAAMAHLRARGGALLNADITIICEAPKVSPYRDAMRQQLAQIMQVELGRVSVKATTTDGLGFAGRGEGIAAQAIVTIRMGAL